MKRTRTGSSAALRGAVWIGCAFLLAAAGGAEKKKSKASQSPYAVVAGTVFQENGMSLGGAEMTLSAAGDPEQARNFKKMKVVANSRGEFAFHVPVTEAEYTVMAKAPGYAPQEKKASIAGETRVDVFFRLEPASK